MRSMFSHEFGDINVIRKFGSTIRKECSHPRHFDGVGFQWDSKAFPYFAKGYFGPFIMHVSCCVKKHCSQHHLCKLAEAFA